MSVIFFPPFSRPCRAGRWQNPRTKMIMGPGEAQQTCTACSYIYWLRSPNQFHQYSRSHVQWPCHSFTISSKLTSIPGSLSFTSTGERAWDQGWITYNLKKNGTSGPPLPPFQWCQNGAFLAPSRLHHCFGGGGWGIIVPLYTVQDCSFLDLESEIERVLQETNNSARKSKTLFILKLNIIIFPLYNINERFRCTS